METTPCQDSASAPILYWHQGDIHPVQTWPRVSPPSLLEHFSVDQGLSGCELLEAEEQRQEREQEKPRSMSCRWAAPPKELGIPGGEDPAAVGGVHMPPVVLEENVWIGLLVCVENSDCKPLVLTRGKKKPEMSFITNLPQSTIYQQNVFSNKVNTWGCTIQAVWQSTSFLFFILLWKS